MKLEMNTNWLHIIEPCTYWGGLSLIAVHPDHVDDMKQSICKFGERTINEILEEIEDKIGECKVSNTTFHSPNEYNYSGDWLEFEMEVPEDIREVIVRMYEPLDKDDFYTWTVKNFGSHPGFYSFFPYSQARFEAILSRNEVRPYDFNRALAMFMYYILEQNDCNLQYYQHSFEEDVFEDVAYNGWEYDEEDE